MSEPTPARIGYTVVGGFLGAGKTTWLNRRLEQADGRRLAVVVNDFGDVNVDAALLGARTTAAGGRIVELTNGCACCTAGSSLSLTLRDLATGVDGPVPDEIVVEASGAADPAVIAGYGSRRVMTEASVVVLVDAARVTDLLQDTRVSRVVAAQIVAATDIEYSRLDLASSAEIEGAVEAVDAVRDEAARRGVGGSAHASGTDFVTASFDLPVTDLDELPVAVDRGVREIVTAAGITRMLRVKGIVSTPDGHVVVQAVSDGELDIEPFDDGSDDSTEAVGRVVVIGTTAPD